MRGEDLPDLRLRSSRSPNTMAPLDASAQQGLANCYALIESVHFSTTWGWPFLRVGNSGLIFRIEKGRGRSS